MSPGCSLPMDVGLWHFGGQGRYPMPDKILIVDDEPNVIRSLLFVLKREGYQVETAKDGIKAIEKVKRWRPCLVILDIMLPGIDGVRVCREIKADPELRDIYILVLSAKAQEEDRQKIFSAGANGYMTKPFSPKDVVEHLRILFQS